MDPAGAPGQGSESEVIGISGQLSAMGADLASEQGRRRRRGRVVSAFSRPCTQTPRRRRAAPAGFGGGEVRRVLGCPPPSRGLRDEGHEGEDNPTPPPGRPGGLPPGEEGMNERRADGPGCRRRAEVRFRCSKAQGSGAAPRKSPPRKGDRRRRGAAATAATAATTATAARGGGAAGRSTIYLPILFPVFFSRFFA
jgi:hypothetical protein